MRESDHAVCARSRVTLSTSVLFVGIAAVSKAADKSAHRSALKAQFFRGPILKAVPRDTSWWLVGAGPDDRDQFIAAAHQRAAEVWTNVAPHAMNPRRGEFA